MRGIDCSFAQGAIDWKAVKNSGQAEFAMIREGYGWGRAADSRFAENAAGCEREGIPYGVYHYSYAMDRADAAREAKSCLSHLEGRTLSRPVAFDFEEPAQLALPPERQLEIIEGFLEPVEAAGCRGMLYMSAAPLARLAEQYPERLKRYGIWVAHVGVPAPACALPWTLWQYSWKGRVPGISGEVDLNEGRTQPDREPLFPGSNRMKIRELEQLLRKLGVESISINE